MGLLLMHSLTHEVEPKQYVVSMLMSYQKIKQSVQSDIIIVHPGWVNLTFRHVWPMLLSCFQEFYYTFTIVIWIMT